MGKKGNMEAAAILAEIEGHLLADVRVMRHWATLEDEPPTGLGRLNFALMAISLIGCERLGFLVNSRNSRRRVDCHDRDPGGYIVGFIDGFFPAKHRFKLIAKILADAMRHELVHGFGGRDTTAPFELGLYISSDPKQFYEVRSGAERPTLAINAVAFADAVLAGFARLKKRVDREACLGATIEKNAAVPFTAPAGVVAEWKNRVIPQRPKAPANSALHPTPAASFPRRNRARVNAKR